MLFLLHSQHQQLCFKKVHLVRMFLLLLLSLPFTMPSYSSNSCKGASVSHRLYPLNISLPVPLLLAVIHRSMDSLWPEFSKWALNSASGPSPSQPRCWIHLLKILIIFSLA